MKRLFALAVIIVLAFNTGGFWLLFELQKLSNYILVQKELKSSDEYEIIKLSRGEFNRCTTKAKEIKLGDQMYDFNKKVIQGDTVIIYCIRDTREENLISAFYKYLKNHHSKENDKLLSHFIQLLHIVFVVPDNFPNNITSVLDNPFREWRHFYQSVFLPIDSPPPKC
ncbi:MAG: hypothetical protein NT175_04950 [Bacteroidetes bacterium]|nr:hypothetical protein [Bacteroidota bacterium]